LSGWQQKTTFFTRKVTNLEAENGGDNWNFGDSELGNHLSLGSIYIYIPGSSFACVFSAFSEIIAYYNSGSFHKSAAFFCFECI